MDYCELHPEETWKVNVEGNKNVIDAATSVGAKIVYYSTDFVFDGKNGPYKETDATNPICEYGRQKLAVEHILQKASDRYLIIRTTIIYGWEERGKNFFCHLLNTLEKGETMKVPVDQIGTPTLAEDLAEVSCTLAEATTTGIVHVVGHDRMNRYQFAQMIAQIFNLPLQMIIAVDTAELRQAAPRPLNAGLISDRLQKTVALKMRGCNEGLEYLKGTRKAI